MKSPIRVSICLMIPLAQQTNLMADIAIDPKEVVPADEPSRTGAESWTTMVAGGLLLCALVAIVIVRLRNARQKSHPDSSADRNGP